MPTTILFVANLIGSGAGTTTIEEGIHRPRSTLRDRLLPPDDHRQRWVRAGQTPEFDSFTGRSAWNVACGILGAVNSNFSRQAVINQRGGMVCGIARPGGGVGSL